MRGGTWHKFEAEEATFFCVPFGPRNMFPEVPLSAMISTPWPTPDRGSSKFQPCSFALLLPVAASLSFFPLPVFSVPANQKRHAHIRQHDHKRQSPRHSVSLALACGRLPLRSRHSASRRTRPDSSRRTERRQTEPGQGGQPPLLSLLLSLSLLFFQHSTWLGGQVAGGAVVTALGRSSSRLALPLVIEMRHSQRIPRLERKILEMNLPILLNISTNRCLVSSLIDRVSFHVLPKKTADDAEDADRHAVAIKFFGFIAIFAFILIRAGVSFICCQAAIFSLTGFFWKQPSCTAQQEKS